MKKILQFKMMRSLLLIVIAVMGFSSSGWADPTNYGGLLYNLSSASPYTAELVGVKDVPQEANFSQQSTSITVPAEVVKGTTHYTVTIAANAFANCSKLTSITISNGITKIDDDAFTGCNSLKAVFFEATTSVPVFSGNLPNNECFAYVQSTALETYSAAWPSKNTSLLKKGIINETFTKGGFEYIITNYNTVSIHNVVSNDQLTYYISTNNVSYDEGTSYKVNGISANAFTKANSKMKSIVIPSNIDTIEAGAFTNSGLKYIMFDGKLPGIGGNIGTTADQIVIKNVQATTLPTGFNSTNIPLNAGTGSFYVISIINGNESLVTALTTATLGNYTTDQILNFDKSKNLAYYDVLTFDGIDYWTVCSYDKSKNATTYDLDFPGAQIKDVTKVDLSAYSDITEIANNCFSGYNMITSITLNSGLTEIGLNAFYTGSKLADMTLPATVTKIHGPIFNASLPDNLTLKATTPPDFYNGTSIDKSLAISQPTPGTQVLVVPSGTVATYQEYNGTTNAWGQYTKAYIQEETFTVGNYKYAYRDATKKSVILIGVIDATKTVYDIPAASGYAKVTTPTTATPSNTTLPITAIGDNVFAGCTACNSFIIPEGIDSISIGAFGANITGSMYVSLPSTLVKANAPFSTTPSNNIYLYFRGTTKPTGFTFEPGTDASKIYPTAADSYGFSTYTNMTLPGADDSYFYVAPYWYQVKDAAKDSVAIVRPHDYTADSYTIPSTVIESLSNKTFTVKELQQSAFAPCSSTKFTTIDVPATVTRLGGNSLNTDNLAKINLKHKTIIPNFDSSPFNTTSGKVTLYVEKGTKGMKGGYGYGSWAGILAKFIIEDGGVTTHFSDGTFYYTVKTFNADNWDYEVVLDSLASKTATAYTIPDSVKYATDDTYKYKVTEIGASAFAGISALTIVIPSTVQAIDAKAFDTDNYPKYVVLPKTPATGMTIAADAFKSKVLFYTEATKPVAGWDNIKGYEITVPTGTLDAYTGFTKAKVLGDENSIYSEGGVWYQVYSATNTQAAAINPVDMGSKDLTIATKIIKDNFIVDKIAEKAFSNSALTSIKLGDSLKIIGDSAFWFTYITKISLPASVDSIGSSALRTSSTSGSTLALTDITVNNDTPCKWHAGDTYLPKNGVKLHVSSTTVKNAYMSKEWEGYTSTYESLIIPTKDETLVSDLVKGSDVTIVDGSNFHIGTSSVNYGYTSNTFADYSPKNITIMDAVTKLTLSKDTVSGTVTVSSDKSDKIGLVLNIANSLFGSFTNNDTVQIAIDSKSKLGTITNNGVLVEESGVISKIDAGKTQMSVAGDINKSFPGNSSTKIFASATVLKGSAKADSVQFVWQLKDAKSVYQTIAKGTHYALAKKSGLRAAATKTLIDSLTVTEGGDYRCLITDFDSTKTAYATLGVYGTVTTTTPKTVGVITLKAFKKGYYKGVSYGKDSTFVFTKDTSFEFQIMDTLDYLIKNYAVVTATYKSTGEKDTLTADINFFYKILHTDDTITVSVDSCIITANEPISLTNNVKVWGNDGILHVSAPQRVTVYIATFDGRMRAVKSEAGDQEFYLGKGIYIIRIEDKTWKIKI